MVKKIRNNIKISSDDKGRVLITVNGDVLDYNTDDFAKNIAEKLSKEVKVLVIEGEDVEKWDSSLLAVLYKAVTEAKKHKIVYKITGFAKNVQDLLNLSLAVENIPNRKSSENPGFLERLGKSFLDLLQKIGEVTDFLIEVCKSLGRFLCFRSVMRARDFWDAMDKCGPAAVGIVCLISFLVGLILAFVGSVQLQTFGAQIYVASLVTIGMCRIMGAIMVGIIMAGRTGSSYAATIGTMQVNEELDALQTMGIAKTDFLVLPRLLSLLIAMPILTMIADFMGMVGGAFVGVFIMNLPHQEYWQFAINSFKLHHFVVGIVHGFCFGIIIALCGCYTGLKCGRNADSVGIATTKSVVYAVVWMIVVTGIITVICQELKI
ncbi:MAG: ABC transporter permease [Alphaproteobacteria bacterium]|nr:ABC transporter permease [Alphaproteobacteria bacterium]